MGKYGSATIKYSSKDEVINMSSIEKQIAIENYPYLTKKIYKKRIKDNINLYTELYIEDDNPIIERDIAHYIYFKNEADMRSFRNDIIRMNYSFEPIEKPPGLIVKTMSKTDVMDIHYITLKIHNLSAKHNGKYESWDTSICK